MFKTDKKSLEELSFLFNASDIARFKHLIENLRSKNLASVSSQELARITEGLDAIGQLKLNGKIYAFNVTDEWAAKQGGDAGWGIELYRRQGDKLEDFAVPNNRDWCYKFEDLLPLLKKEKVDTLYTGQFNYNSSFLNLPQMCDKDDPIERNILEDAYILNFRAEGIKVIVLESLI